MPYSFHDSLKNSSTLAAVASGAGTMASGKSWTIVFSRPGCGRYAMSGALPAWMRTSSWASNSREPSYSTVTPVHSSNGS